MMMVSTCNKDWTYLSAAVTSMTVHIRLTGKMARFVLSMGPFPPAPLITVSAFLLLTEHVLLGVFRGCCRKLLIVALGFGVGPVF
jgi:hypothetical protein